MSSNSTPSRSTSFKAVDHPVLSRISGKDYDLRCKRDRDERFNKMLSRFDAGEMQSVPVVALNCLSFDYLPRLHIIKGKLLWARDSIWSNKMQALNWIVDVLDVLSHNRLILRFIFKSMHIDFWKHLLSAQFAMLNMISSLITEGPIGADIVRKLGFGTAQRILHSMPHWNAEQLLFARELGLFALMVRQYDQNSPEKVKGVVLSILFLGHYLNKKFKIAKPIPEPKVFDIRKCQMQFSGEMVSMNQSGHRMIRLMRSLENRCGWPSCHRKQEGSDGKVQKWYICKGCELIKYCCRNHQKKHWKFIHSQQCRKYY